MKITNLHGLKFAFKEVSLSQIDRDPGQPRQTFSEIPLRQLADSIREHGLIQLPVIKPNPSIADRYLIVAGERRIRALGMNGVEAHPFIIANGATNTFRWSLVENVQREDLNAIEFAQSVKKCRDEGMTWEQISVLTGKHYTTLSSRIKLLELPEEIQQMVIAQRLPSLQNALGLAQFKGTEKGRLIQMAHALIAGEELLELSEKKVQRHETHLARFMPSTPAGMMQRILDLARRGQGAGVAMQEFCKLSKVEREAVWKKLQPVTRKHLLDRNLELQAALSAFVKVVGVLNGSVSATPEPRPTTVTVVAPLRPPTPKPVAPSVQKEAPLVAWKKDEDPEPKPAKPSVTRPQTFSDESMRAGSKILRFMVDSLRSHRNLLLSKARLTAVLANGNPAPADIESVVVSGLRAVQACWHSTPADAKGDLEKEQFIHLISHSRYDLGITDFQVVINFVKDRDRSSDPINLDRL